MTPDDRERHPDPTEAHPADRRGVDPTSAASSAPATSRPLDGTGAATAAGPTPHHDPGLDPGTPERIGAYRVRRLLAQGGMGAVYIAEQENPQRTVALKVIRPGHATPELLARFENEAQVLGLLHHPGIAQIYEAGTADTGHGRQPFFAMELVEGLDLTRYAREQRLDTRRRLELVARVCDAVAHAHQRGVIHRDLKPSNIIVDADGQPKILDFGVARATDADLRATVNTTSGQIVGTLPYMSPEQIAGRPEELDTRSDVYALGVILHELLTDKLPYDLTGKSIIEVARAIQEDEPAPLSSVSRSYRGDIETIVRTALAKEKERRYPSVLALGGDVRRYLADEPIQARPPSTMYHLRKFARRHRALVSGAALAVAALIVGLVVASYAFVQAARARDRAEAINEYLVREILAAPDPEVQGVEVKIVDVIDRAASGVESAFAGQPELEADLQITLATTYTGLGLFDRSEEHARRALELRSELYGEAAVPTLEALGQVGRALLGQDRFAEAITLLTTVVEGRRRTLGADDVDTFGIMADLAASHARSGEFERAIEIEREVLAGRLRLLGPEDPLTLQARVSLAATLSWVGASEEAEALYKEAYEVISASEGDASVTAIGALNGLSELYYNIGDAGGAEEYGRRAWEASRGVYGEDHQDTAVAINNVANALVRRNDYEAAEPLRRRVLEIYQARLGEAHQWTLVARHNLATTTGRLGRWGEAEQMHLDNLARRREHLGEESYGVAETLSGLGVVYNSTGNYPRAIEVMQESLRIYRAIVGEDHVDVATTLSNLGEAYRRNGDFAAAAGVIREVLGTDLRVVGPTHEWVMNDYRDLIRTLIAAGDPAGAEQAARARLEHTQALDENDPNRLQSASLLGYALAHQGRYDEAEPLLLDVHAALMQSNDLDDGRTRDNVGYLAELYEAWGKPEKAAPYRALLQDGEKSR